MPILAPVLLAGLLLAPGDLPRDHGAGESRNVTDPCDGRAAIREDPACAEVPLCSARQRVRLACDLRDAIEQRYVFFPVKDRLLASAPGKTFDPRDHLAACVLDERAIPREDDPLRFYDRMRRCTAAFEDGHLLVGAPARLPQVALGVGLRLVEGRVHIANRERKLVSYLGTISGVRDIDTVLAVGNEVLEIDGRPASEALAELARLLPGSSDAARRERAVDALTRRDFAFPERRTVALTVAVSGARRSVELPWWISPDAERHVMTRGYLRRTGIATTDLLAWRYDQAKDTWAREAASAQGHLRSDPIVPARDAAGLREYLDAQERVAVRLGEVVRRRDRAFCYLQILTFHTETLSLSDVRQPFGAVLDRFVGDCREKQLDLVLDLRHNDGGYIAHTSALASSLSSAGKAAPGGALLLRATTRNQLVYQQRTPATGATPARDADDALEPGRIGEAIAAALRAGLDFAPAFLEAPIRPRDAAAGFDGTIVVLVSPSCMSACDRLAGLLRRSGRAVLVGAPTEGAGGSQQEARNLAARWSDAEGLLTLSIPNAAMGIQLAVPAAGRPQESPPEEFFRSLALENRPVEPDVPYAPGLHDLKEQNRGWLAQVEAVLFEPSGAGSAGP
jgi:hypothetical protein